MGSHRHKSRYRFRADAQYTIIDRPADWDGPKYVNRFGRFRVEEVLRIAAANGEDCKRLLQTQDPLEAMHYLETLMLRPPLLFVDSKISPLSVRLPSLSINDLRYRTTRWIDYFRGIDDRHIVDHPDPIMDRAKRASVRVLNGRVLGLKYPPPGARFESLRRRMRAQTVAYEALEKQHRDCELRRRQSERRCEALNKSAGHLVEALFSMVADVMGARHTHTGTTTFATCTDDYKIDFYDSFAPAWRAVTKSVLFGTGLGVCTVDQEKSDAAGKMEYTVQWFKVPEDTAKIAQIAREHNSRLLI